MALSGFQAAYSLAWDLGSTGLNIFTGTSIIIWTFATATTGGSPRAASVPRSTALSSMEMQCMISMGTRRPEGTSKRKILHRCIGSNPYVSARTFTEIAARPFPSMSPGSFMILPST